MKTHAPKSHPRYWSNYYRDLLVEGVTKGITSEQGLIAHGRGETFDYLIGEKTQPFALTSIRAAAAQLLTSYKPVLSINGNTAILSAKDFVDLSKLIKAPIEINLFHRSKNREIKIIDHLRTFGAENILFPDNTILKGIDSNRKMISRYGQNIADTVFVPLEDGDRTQALINLGKKVITVDLNPMSRTAQTATITISDNITRCLPILIDEIIKLKSANKTALENIIKLYDNKKNIKKSIVFIANRLKKLKI